MGGRAVAATRATSSAISVSSALIVRTSHESDASHPDVLGITWAFGGRSYRGRRQRCVTSDPPESRDRGVADAPPIHRPAEPVIDQVFSAFRLPAAEGAVRLMLVGELDLVTADRARAAIRAAQGEASTLICDLGDVWFVDLSGLRVLLDAATRAERTGGRLTIASCPAIVPRMLRLLELDAALEIEAPVVARGGI
jgi:anti-sigma B factor antagonist